MNPVDSNPFVLGHEAAYARWRAAKLAGYPRTAAELLVTIANPFALTIDEKAALLERVRKTNMAVYACSDRINSASKEIPRQIGAQFGLLRLDDHLCVDEDGISSLQVMEGKPGRHEGYIPYTNRAINWHTDGYYNTAEHSIRGMLLHCANDAIEGGENELLDHEIVYLLLRDENPNWIAALMQPDVMTIPGNVENGVELRPEQSGPVFSLDSETGSLHMRYTARARNIVWKQEPVVQQALEFLDDIFENGDFVFRHRLTPGQGLICNNVLHTRTGFTDGEQHRRLMYRARYYDRIVGT